MIDHGVSITHAAQVYLNEQIDLARQEMTDVKGIRIGVKKAGCSGYEYTVELAQSIDALDIQLGEETHQILISPEDVVSFLKGTTIDYDTGEFGAGLVFKNPNVEANCGCGDSFALKASDDKA